jgi:hypothetical protein
MAMSDLSDDEFTVLRIAAQGESMMAIGRWQKPVESLLEKGLMQSRGGDNSNCVITAAGRAVAKAAKEAEDAPFRELIETGSKIGATQKGIRDFAEQAAQLLAKAAKASHGAVGDAPEYSAKKWSEVILQRALEILRD